MKKLVLITMMLCAAWSVQAQSVGTKFFDEASALYYNITSDTTVEVTYDQLHFNTYVGDFVVPSRVTYEGAIYTVTAIGEAAFQGCEGELHSVIVPNTIKTIGVCAFASSRKLSLVILPNSIESIGTAAFSNCYGLTSLRLPDGITELSERMFFDCTGLTTIEIPSSVTRIGKSAFGLSYITHINIPESVTYIGESAFESCTRLTSIDIPNSVTEIGPSAFYFCEALRSARLPETLEVIPESLFERCVSLSSINIPTTVTEIGKSAYCYTTSVQEVVIPDAVQQIGEGAFLGCKRVTSVTLPSHLAEISASLFQDCTALQSINIPQSVTSIGANAFKQSGLVTVTFNGNLDVLGSYAFSTCTSLKTINLPSIVTQIGGGAFYSCSHLETVNMGHVMEIGAYAFGECSALQTVRMMDLTPPADGGGAFAYCNDSIRLIVPCGAKEIYENSDWGTVFNTIEEDCDGGLIAFQGSEWYYEILNENGTITYQHLEYAADTTVNHKDVQIIIRTNTLYDKDEQVEVTREYLYEEDGMVYWWNKDLQEFTTLYNLDAEVGDAWEIKVGVESITMHVDAVSQYYFGGHLFKTMHVSDADDVFSGIIVCGIGHLTSFFPERLMTRGKGYRVEGMRCYWRDGELFFKYGEEDCDAIYKDYHFGLDEQEETVFAVYPNPTHNVLIVETQCFASQPIATEYRITNLMGQTLTSGQITAETQQIDVSTLPNGMFFVVIGHIAQKFVVQ